MDRQRRAATEERQPTQLAFHASRIIIDVGVLLALGAMSLAFVESPNGDRSSLEADALPALLLLIPIFLITLIPDHTRPIPNPLGWPALVLGTAAFPYAIVKFLDTTTLAETLEGTVGLGARLLVFGTFVTVLGIAVGLARNLLRLPTGGTYPGSRARPRLRRAALEAGRPVNLADPRTGRAVTAGAANRPAPEEDATARTPASEPAPGTTVERARPAEREPRSGRALAERARRVDAAETRSGDPSTESGPPAPQSRPERSPEQPRSPADGG